MGAVDLRSFSGSGPLAEAAAADWLREIAGLRSRQPKISVALAGGRIARQFCSAVASRAAEPGSLEGVQFFWSDERCVPPGDPESNFRLANEALLRPMAIPAEQIHRIRGELAPADAASRAESELRAILCCLPPQLPKIDFVFLGMGEDGHTASLFPGEGEEEMSSPALFRSVTAVKPPPLRVTMGYGTLAAARSVWVLASGTGKGDALKRSMAPGGRTPLGRVIQLRESTRIYSDIS